jgi:Zn-dependent protease
VPQRFPYVVVGVMRDPITWSFPLGRMFGIDIRVHVMLPLVMLALLLRAVTKDSVPLLEAAVVLLFLFVSILLHEFGHCFAARSVDGDASEVLLWPLGGLAYCDLPHTPRAHLITAIGGPAVNVLLCVVAGGALAFAGFVPPLNPLVSPFKTELMHWRSGAHVSSTGVTVPPLAAPGTEVGRGALDAADPPKAASAGAPPAPTGPRPPSPSALVTWQVRAAQLFWVNWFLLALNLLPGFPLDGGRMLQAVLWWRSDYRQSMATASYAGFIVMLIIAVYAIVADDVLAFGLGLLVYLSCKQQLIMLETGGEDAPFGYDFSQGYTSLEGLPAAAPPKRRRPNFFQRWLQRRAAKKAQRDLERREYEDRRMDELLEKVQRDGIQSLTDEERRFMTRVSARYRGGKP